jgi:hypothetical protein
VIVVVAIVVYLQLYLNMNARHCHDAEVGSLQDAYILGILPEWNVAPVVGRRQVRHHLPLTP